jgi:uncharacterized protein (UPF0264 family)
MPRLLISVRNASEARDAITGNADLIDVKEPAYGSLGQADVATIAEIAAVVGASRPVSAAMGELVNSLPGSVPESLRYVKWGLSGCANQKHWWLRLAEHASAIRRASPDCQPVGVAYADHALAGAPGPTEVLARCASIGCPILLVDTSVKERGQLLNWLALDELAALRDQCRASKMQLALAGGITMEVLPSLVALEPDWIAIRGAACRDGRTGTICPQKVQELANLIHRGANSTDSRHEGSRLPHRLAASPRAGAF